jgi:Mg2+ and Co2+ transporter CorA
MNVPVPERYTENLHCFIGIVVLGMAIAYGFIFFFKTKGWGVKS